MHKVTAILGAGRDEGGDGDYCGDDHNSHNNNEGGRHDAADTLVETLAEAAADGVDVAR